MTSAILVINSGSSSFKYQLIDIDTETELAGGAFQPLLHPAALVGVRNMHVLGADVGRVGAGQLGDQVAQC